MPPSEPLPAPTDGRPPDGRLPARSPDEPGDRGNDGARPPRQLTALFSAGACYFARSDPDFAPSDPVSDLPALSTTLRRKSACV